MTTTVENQSEFVAYNPATGESLPGKFLSATSSQIDQTARQASDAFDTYRFTTGAERAAFLRAIAANIESRADKIVPRAMQETGLAEPRLRGELARTVFQLRSFATLVEEGSWVQSYIDPAMPDRQPMPRPDVRSMLRPLGPVVVFGASNFPLAYSVAGGDTASALAAGCPVIVKAHPAHPGTCELVGEAINDAVKSTKMPQGVFGLLYDSGNEVGKALVTHPLVKAVGFTGSLKGGRALFDLAAARPEPIPVYSEMGSVNPIFLLPNALAENAETIATGLHQSVTGSGGQFCTKPGLVFTDGNAGFQKRFVELMHGSAASCLLHKGIATNYAHGIERLQKQPAIKSLVTNSPAVKGCHASASVFETDVASLLKDWSLGDEVFGPMTLLVRYNYIEELLEVAKHLPGQLGSAIHAVEKDYSDAAKLLAVLETRAGRLIFNQFPTGLEVVPAIVHGGPYPATTDSRTTSVGTSAILRFARPVCFQNIPDGLLPDALKASNPLKLRRSVEGKPE